MKHILAPSMMCADIANMEQTLQAFERSGIDYLHIDIMDGSFVPNITLGTSYVKQLREISKIPLDIHMMTNTPEDKLSWFDIRPGEIVSVHAESTLHLQRTLQMIKALGAKALVALNPATPLQILDYVIDDIDGVLIMTVNPGFAGQKLVPQTLYKIQAVWDLANKNGRDNFILEVDGNVSIPNACKMAKCGANAFVLGTSAAFLPEVPTDEAIVSFKEQLDACMVVQDIHFAN